MADAIVIENISKAYDDLVVLQDLTFSVEEGEIYGLLGPNGAGKTTTIEILTGVTMPDSGRVQVGDHDPTSEPLAVRNDVGILPEKEAPPSFLSPREYFEYTAGVRGIEDIDRRIETWAERLSFTNKLDVLSQNLSRGQQQKVMLTQAFIHEPSLVFIDEPLANLDPVVQETVKQIIVDYHKDGNTLFLSTHRLEIAQELCTCVGILDEGRLAVEQRADDETPLDTLFHDTIKQ